jgi:hypothetical protein
MPLVDALPSAGSFLAQKKGPILERIGPWKSTALGAVKE